MKKRDYSKLKEPKKTDEKESLIMQAQISHFAGFNLEFQPLWQKLLVTFLLIGLATAFIIHLFF